MKSLLIIILCLPIIISAQVENNIPKDNFIIEYSLGLNSPSVIHLNYEKWITKKDAIRFGIQGNGGIYSGGLDGDRSWAYTLGANLGYRRVFYEKKSIQFLTGLDVSYTQFNNSYYRSSGKNQLSVTIPLELRIKLNDKISLTSSIGARIWKNLGYEGYGTGLFGKMGFVIKL